MASIFKRSRSPFWWIKFRDPATGEIRRESTGFRVGLASERRQALHLRAEKSAQENNFSHTSKRELFSAWVDAYIELKYKDLSLLKARAIWLTVSEFLQLNHLAAPCQVRRSHCLDYITWRTKQRRTPRKPRLISVSTALTEMSYFSAIMSEAIRRGFATSNPCSRLGITAAKAKPKPEMTDADVTMIRSTIANLDRNPALVDKLKNVLRKAPDFDFHQFLHASFEVAIHQGCRLHETHLDLHRDVDVEHELIRFHAKRDIYYETALNPHLKEAILRWRKEGRSFTWTLPKDIPLLQFKRLKSLYWFTFLQHIGLPHLTFHSTRVTCISRLHRAGAPQTAVMQLVNHSSEIVHHIYRRTTKQELRPFWHDFSLEPPSSDKPAARENPCFPPTKSSPAPAGSAFHA